MSNTIPVIDVDNSVAEMGKGMIEASRDMGFFYLRNHDIPRDLIGRLDSSMRSFFSLPEQDKMKYANGLFEGFNGYIPMGGEDLQDVSGAEVIQEYGTGDIKEALDYHCDKTGLVVPEAVPEILREPLDEYVHHAAALADKALAAIASSLGWEQDYFAGMTEPGYFNIRLLHYPPGRQDVTQGCGEHTDYSFITLLIQDDVGGLEVYSRNEWVAATPIEDTIVVNVGDSLQELTGNRYCSNMHRVGSPGADRYCIIIFCGPNLDEVVNGVSFGDYLESKFSQTIDDY